ncbi:hypothetical protein DH2020_025146 [Rehmannia glutinosa]|uniref:E3 ubiquitin-protein ligase RMA n=1 Tax=Rehmannia glutinosa TaxID=99300 RepID=A0ABR0W1E7_REHGL
MEQYLQGAAVHGDFNEDQNWKSLTATDDQPETNPSAGFECNICLDLVRDPVVTFCGHLYCWPCIYRWISFQDDDASPENPDHQKPQCPVCKRDVSEKTLIPLYGRGQTTNTSSKEHSHLIPQRPPSPRCGANLFLPNTIDSHRSSTNLVDPMIGMFGEMVYARIFGNSETTLYTYPNSYRWQVTVVRGFKAYDAK